MFLKLRRICEISLDFHFSGNRYFPVCCNETLQNFQISQTFFNKYKENKLEMMCIWKTSEFKYKIYISYYCEDASNETDLELMYQNYSTTETTEQLQNTLEQLKEIIEVFQNVYILFRCT